MGGTFQATAGFQDSDVFSESNKNGVEMHFEFDCSHFRIQTLAQSHSWISIKFCVSMCVCVQTGLFLPQRATCAVNISPLCMVGRQVPFAVCYCLEGEGVK